MCYEYKGFINPHPSGWTVSKEKLIKIDREGDLEIVDNKIYRKLRVEKTKGHPINNIWDDIPQTMGNEKMAYPTQKPLKLLERIIKASSNEGDVVLDPFCGCATTLIAAETLNRKWIGIDQNKQAFYMNYYRMRSKLIAEVTSNDEQTTFLNEPLEKNSGTKTKDVGFILQRNFNSYRKDLPTLNDKARDKEVDRAIKDSQSLDEKYMANLKEEAKILKGNQKNEFREKLRLKQNNTCKICKTKLYDAFHLDRIIPGSEGGKYVEENLQILCSSCNLSKNRNTNLYLIKKLFEQKRIDESVYELNLNREFKEERINQEEKDTLLNQTN